MKSNDKELVVMGNVIKDQQATLAFRYLMMMMMMKRGRRGLGREEGRRLNINFETFKVVFKKIFEELFFT